MRLKLIEPTNCKSGLCPALYEAENGSLVVQGRVVSAADCEGIVAVADHEALVEIPTELMEQLARELKRRNR